MGIAYLSQDDITHWLPWFWVIEAYKWTADQGRPVPPLKPHWRAGSANLDAYGLTLIRIWRPEALDVTALSSVTDNALAYRWREPPLTARLDSPRDAAWWQALQDRARASSEDWVTIEIAHDMVSWTLDFENSPNFWELSPLMELAHWLQSLTLVLDSPPSESDASPLSKEEPA